MAIKLGKHSFRGLRLDAGISYRFATGIDLPKTSGNLMNSFNANMSLKFGRF